MNMGAMDPKAEQLPDGGTRDYPNTETLMARSAFVLQIPCTNPETPTLAGRKTSKSCYALERILNHQYFLPIFPTNSYVDSGHRMLGHPAGRTGGIQVGREFVLKGVCVFFFFWGGGGLRV